MEAKARARRKRVPVYLKPQSRWLLPRLAQMDGESLASILNTLIQVEAERHNLLPAGARGSEFCACGRVVWRYTADGIPYCRKHYPNSK